MDIPVIYSEVVDVVVDVGGTKEKLIHLPICSDTSSLASFVLQPAAFGLDDVARTTLGRRRLLPWRAKLAAFVHLILEGMVRAAGTKRENQPVPLSSRYLRQLFGEREAASVVRTLADSGVVQVNPRYAKNRFTKSYQLTESYRTSNVVLRPLGDQGLSDKLWQSGINDSEAGLGDHPGRRAVWENLHHTAFDPAVFPFVQSKIFESPSQSAAWLSTLRSFAHTGRWLTACDTGRITHNVTQCPRALRPFLRIAGEPVAEVDIVGAQPFFALALYPAGHPERAKYAAAVTGSDFYAEIFNAMPHARRRSWGYDLAQWSVPGATHRDRFKTHVVTHVFFSSVPEEIPPVFAAFAKLFPWLAATLARERALPGGGSVLARRLQAEEAGLIVGGVMQRTAAELPGCRAVTIHDAVLCQARYADAIEALIGQKSKELFGVSVRVRKKYFRDNGPSVETCTLKAQTQMPN